MSNAANKKVLIINTTFKKGGAARVAKDIFDTSTDNLEIFFAYGRGEKKSDSKTFKFGNTFETFIHIALVRFIGLEGWGSYFASRKLINYIKREKFDLINLHNLHGYYLNFFTLIKFIKSQKIPVVWSLHDEWPITWLPAHSLGCEHCKTGKGKCVNTYVYPKNYFPIFSGYMLKAKRELFSSDWNPVIICPSKWLQNNIKNSFLNQYDVRVINNGINLNIFKPAENKVALRTKYNLPTDKKIVVFSASNLNDTSKGASYLLKIAERLKARNYLFVFLGKGELETTANVQALGYIYDKEKFAEIISAADLFCFTSSAETFLLAAAEALACTVPVVGFDLDVVREIVNPEVGLLVPQGDEMALEQAIIKLLEDDQSRIARGEAGRKLVVENFSRQGFLDSYYDLYNELLK